ncbi:hypothetical protein C8F04DRAFT_1235541 [Mycena alexandri]|uniref:Uncharacterized protein n=1 Tax=Mycena alexandri TaxID=1745969 RepID=A0AAD6SSA4_9AGAR|nr:hypothetical protein C8F04DRAFT_1235541 [Mycena alexandri]
MISAGPPIHHGHFCINCAPAYGAIAFPYRASCQGCGANCGSQIYTAPAAAAQPPQKRKRPSQTGEVRWTQAMTPRRAAAREEQRGGTEMNMIAIPSVRSFIFSSFYERTGTLFINLFVINAPQLPAATGTWSYPSTSWHTDFVYSNPSNPKQYEPSQQQPTTWTYIPRDPTTLLTRPPLIPPQIPPSTVPKAMKSRKKKSTTPTTANSGSTAKPSNAKSRSKPQSIPYFKPIAVSRTANNATAGPSTSPKTKRVILPLATDPGPSAPPIAYQTLALLLKDLNRILCTPHAGLPFQFSGTCSVVADAARVRNGDYYRLRVSQVGWEVIAQTVLAFDISAMKVHTSQSAGAVSQMQSAAIWMGAPPDPRLKDGELERPCERCEHLLKIRVWEDGRRAPIAGESIFVELVHYEM